MQIRLIFSEGEKVYAKTKGSEQKGLSVQEVLDRRYQLRRGATKGQVLSLIFPTIPRRLL